jgi:hypothetical protein
MGMKRGPWALVARRSLHFERRHEAFVNQDFDLLRGLR